LRHTLSIVPVVHVQADESVDLILESGLRVHHHVDVVLNQLVVGEYLVESLTSFFSHPVSSNSDNFLVGIGDIIGVFNNLCVVIDGSLRHLTEQCHGVAVFVDFLSNCFLGIRSVFHCFLRVKDFEDFSFERVLTADHWLLSVSVILLEPKHFDDGDLGVSGEVVPVNSLS
jgi:hypothetical protein